MVFQHFQAIPYILPWSLVVDQILGYDKVLGTVEDFWYKSGNRLYQFLGGVCFGEMPIFSSLGCNDQRGEKELKFCLQVRKVSSRTSTQSVDLALNSSKLPQWEIYETKDEFIFRNMKILQFIWYLHVTLCIFLIHSKVVYVSLCSISKNCFV